SGANLRLRSEPMIFGVPEIYHRCLGDPEAQEIALEFSLNPRNDPAEIWRGVVKAWPTWESIDHEKWRRVFQRIRPAWRLDFFHPDDEKAYLELPDEVTIYRGADAFSPFCETGL